MTCDHAFVSREAVSNLWANLLHNSESDVAVTERRRRITIATIWYILTVVLAVLSPDIGSVIDMLGSLAAVFIFVFPGKLCVQYVSMFVLVKPMVTKRLSVCAVSYPEDLNSNLNSETKYTYIFHEFPQSIWEMLGTTSK
jgi:rRNA processing protein Gar1